MSIFRNLFRREQQYLIGVDIGSGFLKLSEIDHAHSTPKLTAVGMNILPPGVMTDGPIGNLALLAEQLQQLMLTTGCRSRNVVFSIGGQSAFTRKVVFPCMSSDELKEAISWEIANYIPFAPDSYYYDYSIIDKSDTDLAMKVLLAAAPKAEIDARVALAKQADVKLTAIDIDALAAGRALKLNSGLLVDIGQFITQLTVFQEGASVAARSVMTGGHNFTLDIMQVLGLTEQEAELLKIRQTGLLRPNDDNATDVHNKLSASVRLLAEEMVGIVEFYKMQNSNSLLDKVVLTGGGAKLDNLNKYLEWLSGMPIIELNPLTSVCSDAFEAQYISKFTNRLTVAIGLAMRRGSI